MKRFLLVVLLSALTVGCAASRRSMASTAQAETPREVESALGSVVGAISGKTVDEKDLRDLSRQIQRDPEAQQAIESVANTMSGADLKLQYCPVDGQRFSGKFTVCPQHNVSLQELE